MELNEKIEEVTNNLVEVVNGSGLPPIIMKLILQCVVGDVNNCVNKDTIMTLKKEIEENKATNQEEGDDTNGL